MSIPKLSATPRNTSKSPPVIPNTSTPTVLESETPPEYPGPDPCRRDAGSVRAQLQHREWEPGLGSSRWAPGPQRGRVGTQSRGCHYTVATGKAQPSEPISALLRPPGAPSHASTTLSPLHARTTVNKLAAELPLPPAPPPTWWETTLGLPPSTRLCFLLSTPCLLLLLEHSKGVPSQHLAFHLSGRT